MEVLFDTYPQPYFNKIPFEGRVKAKYISWTPPYINSWKLNFASAQSVRNGVGYIIRDENAFFKTAGSFTVCYDTLLEDQLEVIRSGLADAVCHGVNYLEVEGDSSFVMRLLLEQLTPFARLPKGLSKISKELVMKCKSLLQSFHVVKFHHIPIFANRAANKLAKIAADMNYALDYKEFWCDNPPSIISEILVQDVIGYYDDRHISI